jgi:hypothetical protein
LSAIGSLVYLNLIKGVPDLGLASEHGYLYRYNSQNKEKWEKLIDDINM